MRCRNKGKMTVLDGLVEVEFQNLTPFLIVKLLERISIDVSDMISKMINAQLQDMMMNVKYIQSKKLPLICENSR